MSLTHLSTTGANASPSSGITETLKWLLPMLFSPPQKYEHRGHSASHPVHAERPGEWVSEITTNLEETGGGGCRPQGGGGCQGTVKLTESITSSQESGLDSVGNGESWKVSE